jgi:DNA-binding transcriptional MerR regulator/flavin-binding protein dodecin
MQQSDDLITRQQAAEILGVTVRHLRNLVRQGTILPADTGKGGTELFRAEEVYALTQLRGRRLDLADTARMAMQAHATARATQQRLDKLCRLLGFDVNRLSYEDEAVHALHAKVQHALTSDLAAVETGELMDWAATFHGIDESYLRVVEDYTSDDEPWDSYLALANALMKYTGSSEEVNTRFAFACLDSARKHLRHVSYFYVRTTRGVKTANAAFEESVDDEIIGQLYPMQVGPD